MNKTFKLAAMALGAAALVLAACTKEVTWTVADNEQIECTLQADVVGGGAGIDIDTKVALNGVTPNWEDGDQILVLDADRKPVGKAGGIFTLSSGAGTTSGTFTGKVNVGQTATYAIYPASAATVSGTNPVTAGNLVAPTGNDAGTVKGAIMLGKSSDGSTMAFSNACAVLKINTGSYGRPSEDHGRISRIPAIKAITVSASYGSTATPVAGAFSIDWAATPPAITAISPSTVTGLTIELPSDLQANNKNIYIPIFPLPKQGGTTAPSMKYVFTNDCDIVSNELSYDFSEQIPAGTIKNLGTAKSLEFVVPGNMLLYDWNYPYLNETDTPCNFEDSEFGDAKIISNTYSNGKGIVIFDRDVQLMDFNVGRGQADWSYCITSAELPSTLKTLDFDDVTGYGPGIRTLYIPDSVTSFSVHDKAHSLDTLKTSIETLVITWTNTIHHKNFTYTFYFDYYCFVNGTLITLADGSRKPVEEITYDDELRVWNFDKGCFDSANILWLTKEGKRAGHYFRCTFSDGTVLNLVGTKHAHRLYNYTDRFFEGTTYITPGKEIFTENGVVKLVSCERVDSLVEYVNLMTDRHVNCFAEGVLTSARYNNTYPIDEDMKFIKDGRKIRPYKEFKAVGISREWYNGLRLGEQTDSLARIKAYVDNCEKSMRQKPAPTFWQRLKTWWKSIFG